jgi:hypothetical protein
MQNATNTKEGTTKRAMLVALIVFAVALVVTIVSFYVWLEHANIFEETGWDAFFALAAISAMVALCALLADVVLGLRAILRSLKDNDSNGGGTDL